VDLQSNSTAQASQILGLQANDLAQQLEIVDLQSNSTAQASQILGLQANDQAQQLEIDTYSATVLQASLILDTSGQ
jgi:hypothetical protein